MLFIGFSIRNLTHKAASGLSQPSANYPFLCTQYSCNPVTDCILVWLLCFNLVGYSNTSLITTCLQLHLLPCFFHWHRLCPLPNSHTCFQFSHYHSEFSCQPFVLSHLSVCLVQLLSVSQHSCYLFLSVFLLPSPACFFICLPVSLPSFIKVASAYLCLSADRSRLPFPAIKSNTNPFCLLIFADKFRSYQYW